MEKRFLLFAALALLLPAAPCRADDADEARKAIAVNRSLLERFEAEYALLEGTSPSPIVSSELDKLRTKIQALNEDSARLRAELPMEEQAGEFLEDVVRQNDRELHAREKQSEEMFQKTQKMHEEALKLVSERKLEEAGEIYEDIVLADPDDDQAYLILGHVYLLTGRYDRAAGAFGNALHIDPENGEQIVPFYQNLVLQAPDDAQAKANLAYAYLFVGDVNGARASFQDALNQDPENASARQGLEVIYGN